MTADLAALRRRSPLGDLVATLAATGPPETVTLTERPFRVGVEVRTRVGDPVAGALMDVLGVALPARVGEVARTTTDGTGRHALALGPGWWLVTDDPEPEPGLECALAGELRAAGGDAVSAVDVSAQRTTLDLAGPYARDVLAHGCALDLHPAVFAPPRCAQTTLAQAQVVLQQLDVRPAYRILARASFAGHVARWLLDAMTEYVTQT